MGPPLNPANPRQQRTQPQHQASTITNKTTFQTDHLHIVKGLTPAQDNPSMRRTSPTSHPSKPRTTTGGRTELTGPPGTAGTLCLGEGRKTGCHALTMDSLGDRR